MRLEAHIDIGGDQITTMEDVEELVREVVELATRVEAGDLVNAGDRVTLYDFNEHVVGHAELIPDWHVGDQVWATTQEAALLPAYVERIGATNLYGFVSVHMRAKYTDQVISPVTVDAHGHDVQGRPRLGRQR